MHKLFSPLMWGILADDTVVGKPISNHLALLLAEAQDVLNLLDSFSTWPPELTPGQALGNPVGSGP